MRIITIQPQQQADGRLPYPYHVTESGAILRQDFWSGNPKKLLGFSSEPTAGRIDLSLREFVREPHLALGMCPVVEMAAGHWATETTPIESVSQREPDSFTELVTLLMALITCASA